MDANWIDLRSDTVTRPTAEMRRAMAEAEVGDDVMDGDPTVDRLESATAERLGKEAALFMPSGTMTNQVAIRIHCRPGDELLCEESSHIFNKQQGGFAQLSQIAARTIPGVNGFLRQEDLVDKIRTNNEHHVRSRLLCLENTHNRAGGGVYPWEMMSAATAWAAENQLRLHLDGARLFNAEVAIGIAAERWAALFDTISLCYSKGLGAPVGSALVGSRDMIDEGRRHRKLFGGGMRQAGIIAAGALYALEHHIPRLARDHEHARILGEAIEQHEAWELCSPSVETNIVIFRARQPQVVASQVVALLREQGILMGAVGQREIRAVTHLDVDQRQVLRAAEVLAHVGDELPSGSPITATVTNPS